MEPRTILIVDDEDHIREVAALTLEAVGGWRVLAAGSGGEAISIASQQRPDAILLDVMMPGLDGPATVAELGRDPVTREIPVVLLTAKVQAADHARFAELGVRGVLAKPFDPLSLPDQVRDALGTAP